MFYPGVKRILIVLCCAGAVSGITVSAEKPKPSASGRTKQSAPADVANQEPRTSETILLPSEFRGVKTVQKLLGQVANDLEFVQQDGKILVVGTADDIKLARKVVEAAQTIDIQDPEPERLAQVVSLGYMRPEDATQMLSQVVPGLQVNRAIPNTPMTVSSQGPFASSNKSLTTLLVPDYASAPVVRVLPAGETALPDTGTKSVPTYLDSGGQGIAKMMESSAQISPMAGNVLVLVGTSQQLEAARALLTQIDAPPAQVVVEARMLEMSPEYSERLGISWADINGVLATTSLKENEAQSGMRFGRFTRNPVEIQATISALIRDGQARILSNPSVSVVNEQEAVIFVGDQLKYLAAQSLDQNGRPLFTLANQDVGVNLVVKPSINLKDNTITLKLVPSVSTFVQFVEAPGGGSLPQVRTRLVDTTVRLRDGELLAIGGLISDQEVVSMQKFPFLGDLPILGQFFRHKRKEHSRTELAILIRPHIVRENETLPATPFTENVSLDTIKPLSVPVGAAAPAPPKS